MADQHVYQCVMEWQGDHTRTYEDYTREHVFRFHNKPDLIVTADPMFHGDRELHNPEDLLVTALSSCHLLTYLALCARARLNVLFYKDEPRGLLRLTKDGGGHFVEVLLRPRVVVETEAMRLKAHHFHEEVHKYCFIARSVNFPVLCEPEVLVR